MLQHLHIRDFAIIPFLEQEFSPGFTAISGETGAGKSILVDALGLLLGERSDSTWVKAGAERAELSAGFDVSRNAEAAEYLRALDLDDGDHCLLRRTIQANGRSRAWINGSPVTVQQLAELGDRLVELHGQNEHLRLTSARRQLQLLDETGDYVSELEATAGAFQHWQQLQERFEDLQRTAALSDGELDLLRYQLDELRQTALPPEGVRELEHEHRLLASAGELLGALDQACQRVEEEETGVDAQLGGAIACLEPVRRLDGDIDAALGMLEEARINCREALASLQGALDRVELNPDRLAAAEQQLSELNALARKHRVEMEALESLRQDLEQRLHDADRFEQQREALDAELRDALDAYRRVAARLTVARQEHASNLGESVLRYMAQLGMQGGAFEIRVNPDPKRPPAASGDDRVTMEVSANPGIPPGPLSRIASGGELSRISLCIKAACTRADRGRTQIFDEVDAGIGGQTANAVGALLQAIAAEGQALCVTHLAQVAACADHQLRVRKQAGDRSTDVDACFLHTQERIDEIARMLGGSQSEQSREHAREMLKSRGGSLH